jgi:hypothetical protein
MENKSNLPPKWGFFILQLTVMIESRISMARNAEGVS